jgi:hypothetical protein
MPVEEGKPVLLDFPAAATAVGGELLFGERLVEGGRFSHCSGHTIKQQGQKVYLLPHVDDVG